MGAILLGHHNTPTMNTEKALLSCWGQRKQTPKGDMTCPVPHSTWGKPKHGDSQVTLGNATWCGMLGKALASKCVYLNPASAMHGLYEQILPPPGDCSLPYKRDRTISIASFWWRIKWKEIKHGLVLPSWCPARRRHLQLQLLAASHTPVSLPRPTLQSFLFLQLPDLARGSVHQRLPIILPCQGKIRQP